MKMKIVSLLLLSLATGVSPAHAASTDKALSAEVRLVIAGLRSYREKVEGLRCAQATVVRYKSIPKEINLFMRAAGMPGGFTPGGRDEETLDTARWYFQKPRLSVLVEHAANNPENARVRYRRLVVDGERASLLKGYNTEIRQAQGDQGVVPYEGLIAPPGNVLVNGVFVEAR